MNRTEPFDIEKFDVEIGFDIETGLSSDDWKRLPISQARRERLVKYFGKPYGGKNCMGLVV